MGFAELVFGSKAEPEILSPGLGFEELYGPSSLAPAKAEYEECFNGALTAHEYLYRTNEGKEHLCEDTCEALNKFRAAVINDYVQNSNLEPFRNELQEAFRSASQAIRILSWGETVGDSNVGFRNGTSNSNGALLVKAQADFELLVARLSVKDL